MRSRSSTVLAIKQSPHHLVEYIVRRRAGPCIVSGERVQRGDDFLRIHPSPVVNRDVARTNDSHVIDNERRWGYSCGRGGRHQKCLWSDASRARSAIARITPAPTEPASWIVSSISSSVAPSFFAPAKWETAQGSQ